MAGHPALQKALIKWAKSNPDSYNAVVWQLVDAAEKAMRPNGGTVAGERQAIFLSMDRILRGGPEEKPRS